MQSVTDAPIRVLLVDDEELAYHTVQLYLADEPKHRFELIWSSSYEAGLAALDPRSVDVCLLDFQLGKRSGLDFLKEATGRHCPVPIVMLTAESGHDLTAMRAGAVDYLIKGEFTPQLLQRSLQYAVERARTLDALRESEERYALAVAGANDGLWDLKLPGNTLYLSARWKAILGYQPAELSHHLDEWLLRVHPDDQVKVQKAFDDHLTGKSQHFECEHRVLHNDGTYRFVLARGLAVRDQNGRATRMAGSLSDVTQSRGHDPLTGLPNRALYLDRLTRVIERARRRADTSFAVLFLDVDRFKIVNDSLGHIVGDELIVSIAHRLEACVRNEDTVARLGGDEFAILLAEAPDAAEVFRVARRIQEAVADPFQLSGRDVFTTVSIGIALGSTDYARAEDLLRDADAAMYRAKGSGKARHELFDKEMHLQAMATLQLESDLRAAIERQEFSVHYQPIISLQTGQILSLEALVRWNHPKRGMVGPDSFIPLAEETGLVVQLDRWVLNAAAQQMAKWQKKYDRPEPLGIAVNVSKKQFKQRGFVEEVEQVLRVTGIAPQSLALEITESVVMDDDGYAATMLSRLRFLQVQLVMDDFGTGYTSLSQLHKLPFSELKIDRSFVSSLGPEAGGEDIVRAIFTLAENIHIPVTAEGVETKAQLAKLRELGAKRAQGYLFSKPLPADAIEKLLADPPRW